MISLVSASLGAGDVLRLRSQSNIEILFNRSSFVRKRPHGLAQKKLCSFGHSEPNSVAFMVARRFDHLSVPARIVGRSSAMPPPESLGVDFDCLVQRDVHLSSSIGTPPGP
ncbi:MAG: hypothetical protein WAK01_07145 [Methylocystis sp.]